VSKVSKNWVVKNGWLVGLALLLVSTLTFVQAQKGLEEQLAGVRLGAQFIDYDEEGRLKPDCLFAIYGMPDYIVGGGAALAQPGLMPLIPLPLISPGMPSGPMMLGGSRMSGMVAGGILPVIPLSELVRISQMPTLDPRQVARWAREGGPEPFAPEMRIMGVPSGPPPAEPEEYLRFWESVGGVPPSELHRFGQALMLSELRRFGQVTTGWRIPAGIARPTTPGTGVRGAEGTTGVTRTFPNTEELAWVIPPFVQLDTNEVYFVYRRQGAHLNFLMELTGTEGRKEFRVVAITVAGRRYDGARTAKGDPFKSIKLGDDLQRVLLRYGQPDEIFYYNPVTLQVVNTPTRHLILRYHRTSNIEFTTLENKVVRIFIFLPR
jgi:hypothetical protein